MHFEFSKAKAAHIALCRSGERAAAALLFEKGYEVLARNFKRKSGEIDIVARHGRALVFVEVKSKRSGRGRPAENLSDKQKSRIARAALTYLREIENPRVPYRFDLVEAVFQGRRLAELRHWQNHFFGLDTRRSRGRRPR